jgi:hypothetical protein
MRCTEDAADLVDVWRRSQDPAQRELALQSLARHGSPLAARALLEIAASPSFDVAQRSQALAGASLVLTLVPLDRLEPLGRSADFLSFDDWMLELLGAGI